MWCIFIKVLYSSSPHSCTHVLLGKVISTCTVRNQKIAAQSAFTFTVFSALTTISGSGKSTATV